MIADRGGAVLVHVGVRVQHVFTADREGEGLAEWNAYGRTVRAEDRRAPLTWSTIPPDYDVQIRALRQRLDLSQARFAELVRAASKAVVYQWESRKRCPSPVFWRRIEELWRTRSKAPRRLAR